MTNRTPRCQHGFAIGVPDIRCPVCHPRADDSILAPRPRRHPPRFRITVGAVLAGATIVRILSNDRVEAACGDCSQLFEICRSAIAKHVAKGTSSRCRGCQKREVRRMLDEKKRERAA